MTSAYYLQKRWLRWYAVMDVPADVRNIIGKTRLTLSLATRDYREARCRAGLVVAEWKTRIARARLKNKESKDESL